MGWETHLTAGGFFGAFFGHSVDPDFGDGFFPSENSQLSFGDGFPAVVDDLELLLGAFPAFDRRNPMFRVSRQLFLSEVLSE